MNDPVVPRVRAGIGPEIAMRRNRLADQLDRRVPIDRGDVADLLHLLNALDDLDALP